MCPLLRSHKLRSDWSSYWHDHGTILKRACLPSLACTTRRLLHTFYSASHPQVVEQGVLKRYRGRFFLSPSRLPVHYFTPFSRSIRFVLQYLCSRTLVPVYISVPSHSDSTSQLLSGPFHTPKSYQMPAAHFHSALMKGGCKIFSCAESSQLHYHKLHCLRKLSGFEGGNRNI